VKNSQRVHRIRPDSRRRIVLRTWCGTDPYRKGIVCEGLTVDHRPANCPDCLRQQRQETKP
jgi:hypothetical protein